MEFGKSLAVAVIVAAVGAVLFSGAVTVADETQVVVTRPGTVFHKIDATDVRGRGHLRGLADAVESGYQPCRVCFAAEAKTSRLAPGPTAAGTSATTGGSALAAPPPASTVSSPFGLRHGSFKRTGGIETGKDPYADLGTVRDPGLEQGAFCCQ